MNELSILKIIDNIVANDYIGDDCAYLKDLGIVITQDSLIEDIHFKRKWISPFQLGYKSVIVNLSDVLASGAEPKYLTIALSLPNTISENFIKDFYFGAKSALNGAKIVGGDITGSVDKIVISITALGTDKGRNISSRRNAKPGYIIITNGLYGSSAAGLNELKNNGSNTNLIKSHLEPVIDYDFSKKIATTVKEDYAMMDTSDGLADAVFKIAEASGVKAVVDYNKIPHESDLSKECILYGGEDYNLIAAIPEKYLSEFPNNPVIGHITGFDGIRLDISGCCFKEYCELKVYNHFDNNNA